MGDYNMSEGMYKGKAMLWLNHVLEEWGWTWPQATVVLHETCGHWHFNDATSHEVEAVSAFIEATEQGVPGPVKVWAILIDDNAVERKPIADAEAAGYKPEKLKQWRKGINEYMLHIPAATNEEARIIAGQFGSYISTWN